MTRRRTKNPKTIPLAPPSTTSMRPAPAKPLIEIPEDEKWRLINQSGILKSSALNSALSTESLQEPALEEELSFSDEIFNAILLIIPFSSILLLMEVLIRHQYGKEATMEVIMDRMVPGVPILSIFIFYSMYSVYFVVTIAYQSSSAVRYKRSRRMQALLLAISVTVGSRMLYLLDNASFLVNMKQGPPLATIWIYTVLQLDLGLAVSSLVCVAGFVLWKDIKVLRG